MTHMILKTLPTMYFPQLGGLVTSSYNKYIIISHTYCKRQHIKLAIGKYFQNLPWLHIPYNRGWISQVYQYLPLTKEAATSDVPIHKKVPIIWRIFCGWWCTLYIWIYHQKLSQAISIYFNVSNIHIISHEERNSIFESLLVVQ